MTTEPRCDVAGICCYCHYPPLSDTIFIVERPTRGSVMRASSVWTLVLIGMAYPLQALAEPAVTDIYNYYPMPKGLGTSGHPTPEQFGFTAQPTIVPQPLPIGI